MYQLSTPHDNLFVNIPDRSQKTFQVYIGARGTGKTFSALRGELNDRFTTEKFIYLRNTEKEVQIATSTMGNAFKSLNKTFNVNIEGDYTGSLAYGEFFDRTDPENEALIGYCFGLSTFAGARSVDLSDVDRIIFEEFIPEMHMRKMKNRGQAFLNFYETVTRNREILGAPPVKCILLANAINLKDEILAAVGATDEVQDMIMRGEKRRTIHERDLYIELVDTVGILDAKSKTALYQLADQDFVSDALKADFHKERLYLIKKTFNQPSYNAILSFGDYCFYIAKDNSSMHIAKTGEKTKQHLLSTENHLLRQLLKPGYLYNLGKDKITFDSFDTRKAIETALDIK